VATGHQYLGPGKLRIVSTVSQEAAVELTGPDSAAPARAHG
jgi:hypothetical protein